jgi:hypothetical protein
MERGLFYSEIHKIQLNTAKKINAMTNMATKTARATNPLFSEGSPLLTCILLNEIKT